MYGTRDSYNYFPILNQPVAFQFGGNESGIRQPPLSLFVLVQSENVFARADFSDNDGAFARRFANSPDKHPIARLVQTGKIVCNLTPVCDSAIVSGRESQHGFRGGN